MKKILAFILLIFFLAASFSYATVTVETVKNSYTGTGTVGPFPYLFKIWADADLKVIKTLASTGTETVLTLNTDYTVTGAGVTAGGTVTLTSVLPVGYTITIMRDMDYLQAANFAAGQAVTAAALNNGFDKLEHQIQQLKEQADRAVQLPRSSALATPYLPKVEAGNIFRWNLAGTGIDTVPVAGLAQNTFIQSGTGAVARTAQAKMGDIVHIRDFGGVGDGITDDTAAMNAAAAYLVNGGKVNVSGGRWLIDSGDVYLPKGVTIQGPYENIGEQAGIDYSLIGSAIILNPSYTIRLWGDGSGVKGIAILNKNLFTPASLIDATALAALFSGTAITYGYTTPATTAQRNKARDGYTGNLLILGFEWMIWCDYNERPNIESIRGDGKNGIYLAHIYDMKQIRDCHLWPFLSAHQSWTMSGPDGYSRSGTAFYFDEDSNWGNVTNLFAFGWATSYRLNDSLYINLVNCSDDHQADRAVVDGLDTKGVYITGDSGNIHLIGHRSAAKKYGLYVDTNITKSIRTSSYVWTKNGATDEYYLEDDGGGSPGIALPTEVVANNIQLSLGTAAGSLAASQWIYAMDPTSAFWTVYVRLADDSDPDTQAEDYVTVAPAAGNVVTAIGCKWWGNFDYHVYVANGMFTTIGSQYKDLYGSGVGIYAGAGAYEVIIGDANEFDGVNTPFTLTNARQVRIAPTNVFHRAYQPGSTWYKDVRDFSASAQGITEVYNDTTTGAVHSVRKAGGTAAAPAATPANSAIQTLYGYTWDGSAWGASAALRTTLRGSVSAGATPGGIIFSTTGTGAASVTDRQIITEAGHFNPITDGAYKLGGSSARWKEVWAANGTIQTSDERLKTGITDSSLGLDFVNRLRPIEFKWISEETKVLGQKYYTKAGKELKSAKGISSEAVPGEIITEKVPGTTVHNGFSAQEVKAAAASMGKTFGGVVYDSETDSYGMNYSEFIPVLTAAIQEQQTQIEALKAELAKQKEPAK